MSVHVYILKSESSGLFYVGISKTPTSRLRQHNADQSVGTRGKGPWIRIASEEYPDYAAARIREKWLKSGVGRTWLRSAFGG